MDFETCEIGGVDPEDEMAEVLAEVPAGTSANIPAACGQDDPKPEYFQYKDEGCTYARSCLGCPYDCCLYEGRRGKRSSMAEIRSREIKKQYKSGRNVKELVDIFRVSNKTIYRAVKTARRKKRKGAVKK
jgi:hypothetical protein